MRIINPGLPSQALSKIGLLAVLGAGLFTGGCSLAPAYERPALTLPATLGSTEGPRAASAPKAETLTRYESDFIRSLGADASSDLMQWFGAALARNADYRTAALQVGEARSAYRIQRASLFPTVSVGGQRTRQHFDDPALSERYEQKISSGSVSIGDFEPDFFGRVASLTEAARERFAASQDGREMVRATVSAEILRGYILEQSARKQLDIQRSLYRSTFDLVSLYERQWAVGAMAKNDYQRASQRLVDADNAVRQAEFEVHAARSALGALAGGVPSPSAAIDVLLAPLEI